MTSLNPRWRRLLSWALRLPSPSKAVVVAYNRKPLMDRWIDLETGAIEPLDMKAEDGLLTFREAWTGQYLE